QPYIVMELLKGRDLWSALREQGPLPTAVAVDYLLQACEALAEAHALGIVHRDLKPANLFLTRRADGSPSIKLLDFGVSKRAALLGSGTHDIPGAIAEPEASAAAGGIQVRADREHAGNTLTAAHAAIGSPRYMAPEQARSARAVDARADIWA